MINILNYEFFIDLEFNKSYLNKCYDFIIEKYNYNQKIIQSIDSVREEIDNIYDKLMEYSNNYPNLSIEHINNKSKYTHLNDKLNNQFDIVNNIFDSKQIFIEDLDEMFYVIKIYLEYLIDIYSFIKKF